MAYNITASLGKLTCTDYVDFGKSQDKFGRFSWSKNDSIYLDIKLNVFMRVDKNAEFRLRQNFLMGEVDFNQFFRQRNQLAVAADNSEKKISRHFFNLRCSKTWRSNWSLFTKWLTLWIARTEGFVLHCCDTRRTNQRLPIVKFVYSEGRRRKKIFNKSCMSFI